MAAQAVIGGSIELPVAKQRRDLDGSFYPQASG